MTTDLATIPGFFSVQPAKYALVDALSYRLWLVDSTSNYLNMIKDAFVSKKKFVVVELSKNNKETEKIDNGTVLQWSFIKQYGIDYFLGKDWIGGFPRIIRENAWPLQDQGIASESDIDLISQLFLYYKILVNLHSVGVVQNIGLKEILRELAEHNSKGLTLDDMHVNLSNLADSLYSRRFGTEASAIFHCLPAHLKYD